jgi:plastocyanin
MTRLRGRVSAVALAGLLAVVAGCGDDDDDTTTTDPPEATDDGDATDDGGDEGAAGDTVEVTGIDYGYEGLPDTIEAGTTLAFVNGSDVEAHELVAIRIPDDEDRPVSELIGLSDEEIEGIFGSAPPALVSIAGPGDEGMNVVGDGVISDPGRYAVVCFFPVGGDPDEILDPEAEGPPDTGDAPPHAAEGMYAELTVQ